MKIKKLITLNWANLPNGEYLFDNLVFLTGETGVGKSTMLDAIQTIMTGAQKNITIYNAGQDEAQNKKRNKEYRTLEGYCVGEDRFKFARPKGCITTIAVVFASTKNEKKNLFTAVLNVDVDMEIYKGEAKPHKNREDFFIFENSELNYEDLVGQDKEILNHTALYKKATKLYDKSNVIKCTGKTDYLNTLYGHLWGKDRVSKPFSEKAARAFSNFIHAKPVDDIGRFVREEFLERKEMKEEVDKLSETIRSLDKLQKETEEIQQGVDALDTLVNTLDVLLKKWFKNEENQYLYYEYETRKQVKKIKDKELFFKKQVKKLDSLDKDEVRLGKDKDILDSEIKNINEHLGTNDKMQTFKKLEEKLKENKKEFNRAIEIFSPKVATIVTMQKGLQYLSLHKEDFQKLYHCVEEFHLLLTRFSELSFNKIFLNETIESKEIESKINDFENIVSELLALYKELLNDSIFLEKKDKTSKQSEELVSSTVGMKRNLKDLKEEINSLEDNKGYCPLQYLNAYKKLQELFPSANARMLYEFVELKDDTWREAIEGFIGGNRFTILVNQAYEKEAIEFIKKEKLNLKVIQGKKVRKEIELKGKRVEEDSIVSLLKVTDETAEAYLIASYGNVLCMKDTYALRDAKRGVTKDAKAANNNVMFDCTLKDKRYIFGEGARKETLKALREEYKLKEDNYHIKLAQKDKYSQIVKNLNNLENFELSLDIQSLSAMSERYKHYHSDKTLQEKIDISEVEGLKKEFEAKEIALSKNKESLKQCYIDKGSVSTSLEGRENKEKEYKVELDKKKEKRDENLKSLQSIYQAYNPQGHFDTYVNHSKQSIDISLPLLPPENLKSVLVNDWENFKNADNKDTLNNSEKIQHTYLLIYSELTAIEEQFIELVGYKKSIQDESNRLKETTLYRYKESITKAKDEVNKVFINDFCQVIYVNIEQGKGYIDDLNRVLKGHTFGNEVYVVKRKKGDEELGQYYQYFKGIYENQTTFDANSLFGGEHKESENYQLAEYLLALFMNTDKHTSELARISDYRNYYNYDIVQIVDGQEISLSRNGKNSGGQGETSYYVIRALNLQASLKPKESRGNALETAIIDESFLKSNEERSKEILRYLTETLGFQVISAMPTKQVGSFYDIESSNYHIVKAPLAGVSNGELDYRCFIEFKQPNVKMIKKLFLEKEQTLLDAIKKDADEKYE